MPTMPDVPSFGGGTAPQPSGGVAAFEPPNWRQVGMAGDVTSSAGRALEEAASTVQTTNDRQDQIVAQAAGNQLASQRIALQYDPDNGYANVKEGDTVGPQFVSTYMQKFDDAAQRIRQNMQTGVQQETFDQHEQLQRLQFQQGLLEHQSQQTSLFNDTTANDTVSLAQRAIAQRPLDEVGFQAGMAQINGTLDAYGQRKGLPPQAIAQMKAQSFDNAYTTRIMSITDGIPGVVQANPYLAEKIFDQVQDQLGPAAQMRLAPEVQNAVKAVQQRDIAQKLSSGQLPTSPALLAPITAGTAPLAAVVEHMESNGDPNAVSVRGAQGAMQVMPDTAANPGYGVRPAQVGADGKPLPGELERVGRDYLGAMTARYDNPAMVLAAYNAGPGQVDKWNAQFGDPRMGQISTSDWVSKIPFSETQQYVQNGMKQLTDAHAAVQAADAQKADPAQFAGTTGADGALPPVAQQVQPQAPTANDLKTRLPAMMAQARDLWSQMYPNDPVGADAVASRVESYWNIAVRGQQAQQQAASDTLTQAVVGQQGDGSDAPRTLEQAFADPQVKAAYDSASPETRLAFQQRVARGDKQLDAQSTQAYYALMGQAGNDPEGFSHVDLASYYGKVPDQLLLSLMTQQKSINAKDMSQQTRDLNWKRSLGDVQQMVAPVIDPKTVGDAKSKQLMDQFSGRFSEALQQYHDANNGKWPDTPTTQKIAGGLLAQGAVAGSGWLYGAGPDATERFFQAQSEGKASSFYVPLPPARSEMRSALNQDFQRKFGRAPASDNELQAAVTKQVLASGKPAPWMPQ